MSISTIDEIIDRISCSTAGSPILVYMTLGGKLDSMFADTVVAVRKLKRDDDNPFYVGVFHRSKRMSMEQWRDYKAQVKIILKSAITRRM